jgi:hypothetical protein
MKHFIRLLAPAALAVTAWSSVAQASEPVSVYARVDGVTFEPDKASATRVQIHGVFAMHTGVGTGFQYGESAPGYMYLACQSGQETLCREQWVELESYIGKQSCAGWGQHNVKTAATVRAPGTTPQDPDVFDLGMGIAPAVSAGGTCPKLLAFAGGKDAGGPAPDGGSSGGSSGATPPAGGTSGTPAPPPGGAGSSSSGGCISAPGSMPLSGLAAAAVAGIALLVARRRRK